MASSCSLESVHKVFDVCLNAARAKESPGAVERSLDFESSVVRRDESLMTKTSRYVWQAGQSQHLQMTLERGDALCCGGGGLNHVFYIFPHGGERGKIAS